MVSKLNKAIIYTLIIFISLIFSFLNFKGFETSIASAILPQNNPRTLKIIQILNKNCDIINVIFEAESEFRANEKKIDFINRLDKDSFETLFFDFDGLYEYYSKNPTNFLSEDTRIKIRNKKYNELRNNAILKLYSPLSFQLISFEKDPYFLLDDFIFSNLKEYNNVFEINGKYYAHVNIKVKNTKKIGDLINSSDENIIFAGNPIHSYYASKSSSLYINIICILTTLLIVFITYYYFKSFKILLPLALSILSGFIFGYFSVNLFFNQIHIFTLLFSSALIGIGIDYSYHFMFSLKTNSESKKCFIKNLTFSYITTSLSFLILYLSGIDLLKQVSVFMIFGLLGIYCFVIFIFPLFKIPEIVKSSLPSLSKKILYLLIGFILFLSFFGVFKIKFDDSLSALYNPPEKLKKAEKINNLILNPNNYKVNFLIFDGKDIDKIIKKEETVSDILDIQNIKYFSISKFIPSKVRQIENNKLVHELYQADLSNFKEFLSGFQIKKLINNNPEYNALNNDIFELFNAFLLNKNQSFMTVYSDDLSDDIISSASYKICIKDDVSNYLSKYRIILLKFLPFIYLTLFIVLLVVYRNIFKSYKVLFPVIFSSFATIFILSFFNVALNLFSVISLFLVIGFTLDYSIFRLNADKNSNIAVFVSCLTTSFTFLLLSFCPFKLISDIALVLFLGVIFSYLSGFLVSDKK